MRKTIKISIFLAVFFLCVFSVKAASVLDDSNLIPATATSDTVLVATEYPLADLKLPQKYYQPDSETTLLDKIKDPGKIIDLTLDNVGQARLILKGTINLSAEENQKALTDIDQYIQYGANAVTVSADWKKFFPVPIEINFYNIPFVSDPVILINSSPATDKDISDYYRYKESGIAFARFITNKTGEFKLTPKLELNFNDQAEVNNAVYKFSGRISDPNATVTVKINSQLLVSTADINSATGEFYLTANLISGDNIIEASAQSALGPVTSLAKTVKLIQNQTAPAKTAPNGINPLIIVGLVVLIVILSLLWILKYLKKR